MFFSARNVFAGLAAVLSLTALQAPGVHCTHPRVHVVARGKENQQPLPSAVNPSQVDFLKKDHDAPDGWAIPGTGDYDPGAEDIPEYGDEMNWKTPFLDGVVLRQRLNLADYIKTGTEPAVVRIRFDFQIFPEQTGSSASTGVSVNEDWVNNLAVKLCDRYALKSSNVDDSGDTPLSSRQEFKIRVEIPAGPTDCGLEISTEIATDVEFKIANLYMEIVSEELEDATVAL